ncbi:MAG: hypothetical protein QOE61_747 [Micromonosporaceae bacterium]|jgi:hypothetical protein|nr:hypothetical protein [Micromonosporaceae bacterium]
METFQSSASGAELRIRSAISAPKNDRSTWLALEQRTRSSAPDHSIVAGGSTGVLHAYTSDLTPVDSLLLTANPLLEPTDCSLLDDHGHA